MILIYFIIGSGVGLAIVVVAGFLGFRRMIDKAFEEEGRIDRDR